VRVVFVCSRGDHAETAELIAPDGAVLRDPFTGETLTAGNGRVRVRVPDRGVRLLIVESALRRRSAPSVTVVGRSRCGSAAPRTGAARRR
jgi:hypothetical protein